MGRKMITAILPKLNANRKPTSARSIGSPNSDRNVSSPLASSGSFRPPGLSLSPTQTSTNDPSVTRVSTRYGVVNP